MKVVHLATTDYGGAYKACERIHQSLIMRGVDSEIYVRKKLNRDSMARPMYIKAVTVIASKVCNLFNLLLSKGDVVSDYFGLNLSKRQELQVADIIVFHWVNSFVSYKNAERILRMGKPVVWVLHDMWLLTGGCHYDRYCDGYSKGCFSCKMVTNFLLNKVITSNVRRKYRMTHAGHMFLVGPSKWMVGCAKQSQILHDIPSGFIPNPINTDVFYRRNDREILRKKYNLFTDKKVILFGADNPGRDSIKGEHLLLEALKLLNPKEYLLLAFGGSSHFANIAETFEIKYLGFIKNEKDLAEIYSIADVFVAPSIQECFGYTTAEALCCETPVVAFEVGGHAEQIAHKVNGYLAPLYDVYELAQGIVYCTSEKYMFKGKASIYSYGEIGKMYEEIFRTLI